MEIKHKQLKQLIKVYYDSKITLDIKGPTGIGKSEVVLDAAKELAKERSKSLTVWNNLQLQQKIDIHERDNKDLFIFADLRLSQMDPTDLKGFPKIDDEYVKWIANLLFKILSNPNVEGIVFFDEMNTSSPSVMNAALQIIQDYAIGETPISRNIMFLSAGNRMDDGCQVFEESKALTSRRANVDLAPPSIADWVDWAKDNHIDERIIFYLTWKEDNLFKFDIDSSEISFPCPRMWAKVSSSIKGLIDLNLIYMIVASCVGVGAGKEFIAFLKFEAKVDVDAILSDPSLIEKYNSPKYIDLKYSIIGIVVEKVNKNNSLLNNALGIIELMEPDYGMYMLKLIGNNIDGFKTELSKCNNWVAVSKIYKDYVL